jgi:predicted nucleic acid-binding protein
VICVADSSVLITLGHLRRLDLLLRRFPDGVWAPPAVWHEVTGQGASRPGAREVAAASWVQIENPKDAHLVRALRSDLGSGESEAIVLALEKQSVVLLDEREARKRARALLLPVLGTVGVLIWAKRERLIESVKEALDFLQRGNQFRLSLEVYRQALRDSGEL